MANKVEMKGNEIKIEGDAKKKEDVNPMLQDKQFFDEAYAQGMPVLNSALKSFFKDHPDEERKVMGTMYQRKIQYAEFHKQVTEMSALQEAQKASALKTLLAKNSGGVQLTPEQEADLQQRAVNGDPELQKTFDAHIARMNDLLNNNDLAQAAKVSTPPKKIDLGDGLTWDENDLRQLFANPNDLAKTHASLVQAGKIEAANRLTEMAGANTKESLAQNNEIQVPQQQQGSPTPAQNPASMGSAEPGSNIINNIKSFLSNSFGSAKEKVAGASSIAKSGQGRS